MLSLCNVSCPVVPCLSSPCPGIAIDMEKDKMRSECAGKLGTVMEVDKSDNTAKVRVTTEPGKAAMLWFAIAGLVPER